MEILLIIKSILDKIKFHPLFYIILIISLLTAHFRELIYFTIIIIIHELGHSITGLLLGYKVNKIEIYPYGGCSKLEHDINILLLKELLVLIMGPIIQIIFMLLVYYLRIDVKEYFYTFNKIILIFNLLPIYPLDGGRILNILFNYFFSYYNSLKISIYLSYFLYLVLSIFLLLITKNLTILLITLSLGISIINEIKRADYYFNKFLLERYLNNYYFKKYKKVKDINNMYRDHIHFFLINKRIIKEKEYLHKYFV